MKNAKPPERASLGEIIDELTAEACGDDERIWNFQQALQKHVSLPCDGFVIGEPVKLVSFNYDGNQRRGVTATCRRSDGREYEMAVSEVLVTNAFGRFAICRGLPPLDGAGALPPWGKGYTTRGTLRRACRIDHSAKSGRADRTLGQTDDRALPPASK
jgi:hypothetical protein